MHKAVVPSRMSDRPAIQHHHQHKADNGLTVTVRDPSTLTTSLISNQSHIIKEIILIEENKFMPPRESASPSKTPRRRGDGTNFDFSGYFKGSDKITTTNNNNTNENTKINATTKNNQQSHKRQSKKMPLKDPPGYETRAEKVLKSRTMEPERAASIHRRRKRFIEEKARKIIGADALRGTLEDMKRDDTARTESTGTEHSSHSSWLPVRKLDKDPRNRPVKHSESEIRISRESANVRATTVPQRAWQPHRMEARVSLELTENDSMDFSTTNEWVPSEYYRKAQQQGHNSISMTGMSPMSAASQIVSPYAPKRRRPQNELEQLRIQQQQLLQLQEQQRMQMQQQLLLAPKIDKMPWKPPPQRPPSVIHTVPSTIPSTKTSTIPSTKAVDSHKSSTARQHQQPPKFIHTTPITTTADDYLKRRSLASEMDLSDVVMSCTDSSGTMDNSGSGRDASKGVKVRKGKRNSDENSTLQESYRKLRAKSTKRISDLSIQSRKYEPEESSTIQESYRKLKLNISKKRLSDMSLDMDLTNPTFKRESDESSTIQESLKAMLRKRTSDESKDPTGDIIRNETYSFDANELANDDDGFDESLLSASLTNIHNDRMIMVPNNISIDQFVIPTIFVRKSGTSDLTMDLDATRLMIESQLTETDCEDLTFSSTINESVISNPDAAAMAQEMNLINQGLLGSGVSGLTNSLTNTNHISGLLNSGTTGNISSLSSSGNNHSLTNLTLNSTIRSDALNNSTIRTDALNNSTIRTDLSSTIRTVESTPTAQMLVTEQLSSLADEMSLKARKKEASQKLEEVQEQMDRDIISEVSSYVSDTILQKRKDNEIDSQAGSHKSSWHHRSNITVNSKMASTRKVANKRRGRAKPRRSSTSTLPSIGSIIPEELYSEFDFGLDDDDDDQDDDGYHEIHHIHESDSDDSSFEREIEFGLNDKKLSSILEVASRDVSRANRSRGNDMSRDASRGNRSVDFGSSSSEGDGRSRSITKSRTSSESENNRATITEYWDCFDIRCFDKREEGDVTSRRKFNPSCGCYLVAFLLIFLAAVCTGIGLVGVWVQQM